VLEPFFAASLVVLGVVSYLATGRKSVTALIPAFFGVIVGIAHVLMDGSGYARHVAIGLAVLGVLATGRAVIALLRSATERERPATRSKALMALLCAGYLIASWL
jgi:hypothetical protein